MQRAAFLRFCEIAYARAGIRLQDGKQVLVETRVAKRLRRLGFHSADEYLDHLESDESGRELVEFLNVITTNFTSFFREPVHFELLDRCLRRWFDAGQRRFRIWCAAASTGEEPYSLAITVQEALGHTDADARILATDLSTRVLAHARAGIYDESRVVPVQPSERAAYFTSAPPDPTQRGEGQRRVAVQPVLRDLLVFKRLNLATPPFPMRGPLDVVFCRNVMIYFDRPVRQRLVTEISRLLKPGGLLMIGHTETLTGIQSDFRAIRPSVYQKLPEAEPQGR